MTLLDLVKQLLPPEDWQAFSDRALWAAGESQKPTALPALVLVAASSLLVLVVWLWLLSRLFGRVRG